jgi:hypothetical protein
MKKEFVNYNQSLALKELGFDEPCLAFYDGTWDTKIYFNYKRDSSEDYKPFTTSERLNWFGAPLKQQVFRWFREKHDLLSWIFTPFGVNNGYFHEIVNLSEAIIEGGFRSGQSAKYTTYEEAELACINELIEIIKNKTDEKNNNTDNNNNNRLHL